MIFPFVYDRTDDIEKNNVEEDFSQWEVIHIFVYVDKYLTNHLHFFFFCKIGSRDGYAFRDLPVPKDTIHLLYCPKTHLGYRSF